MSAPTFKDYLTLVERTIAQFPSLNGILPPLWVSGIDEDHVNEYEAHRQDKFWEHLNLVGSVKSFSLWGEQAGDVGKLCKLLTCRI
jgi:hypothetical protein